jgi:hypothetical protein
VREPRANKGHETPECVLLKQDDSIDRGRRGKVIQRHFPFRSKPTGKEQIRAGGGLTRSA